MVIKMKKFLCAAIAAAMTFTASSAVFAGSENVTVILDGRTLSFDVEPQIINDRTMVPMRTIFEALGASVEWNEGDRTITSTKNDTTIRMQINNTSMSVNETEKTLDSAPIIQDGRTLVPARAVAECFDADVSWYGDSKTVLILSEAKQSVVNAKIKIKDYGEISLALFKNIAPKTVENFQNLAGSKFYDNLIFHRVIFGFMIQGGGYDLSFTEKNAQMITGEFTSNGIENNLKHTRGVISMARQEQDHDDVIAKDSASSQFFIMHMDAPSLDGEYASFGIVTEGMDVVDKIAAVRTGILESLYMSDIPMNPIIIESVTIQ